MIDQVLLDILDGCPEKPDVPVAAHSPANAWRINFDFQLACTVAALVAKRLRLETTVKLPTTNSDPANLLSPELLAQLERLGTGHT